jgi:hypothetical protein
MAVLQANPNLPAVVQLQADPQLQKIPPNAGGIGTNADPWAIIRQVSVEIMPMHERFTAEGDQGIERTFLVDWKRRKQFVDAMLGSSDITKNLIIDPNGPQKPFIPAQNAQDAAQNLRAPLLTLLLPLVGGLPGTAATIADAVCNIIAQGGDLAKIRSNIVDYLTSQAFFNLFINPPIDFLAAIKQAVQDFLNNNLAGFAVNPADPANMIQDPHRPWIITRKPPAQDPEYGYEHLYCSDVEMSTGQGVMTYRNDLFARNPGGDFQLVAQDVDRGLKAGVGAPVPPQVNPPAGPAPQPAQAGANRKFVIPLPKMALGCDNAAIIRDGNDLAPIMSPGFGLAQYTCRFTPRPYEIVTDSSMVSLAGDDNIEWELHRYVERAGMPAIQAIPRPRIGANGEDQLIWLAGPNLNSSIGLEQAGQILIHTEELRYTWYDVPQLPLTAFDTCEGTMNATPFDGLFGPFRDVNTLLCQAPKWERKRFPNGRVKFRIVYTFLYRKQGWNTLPNGTDGAFYAVGYKGPPQRPIYGTSDFNLLFRPDPPPVNGFQMGVI